MAFFGVTVETIEKVWNHSNADRLSLAKVAGMSFQFVTAKDQYKVGDKVLYFPIDAVLPLHIIEALGLKGKLSGKDQNRVKTVKLRSEISQGLVCSWDKFLPESMKDSSSEEITAYLGVTKFEPPIIEEKDAFLQPLPSGQSAYDIEGADRFGHIVDLMKSKEVVVTEKLEGDNFSVTRVENDVFVNKRNCTIIPKEGVSHSHWNLAEKNDLINLAKNIPGSQVVIYGEMCGPGFHGNIYNLPEVTLFIFDLKVDYKWVSFDEAVKLLQMKEVSPGRYENAKGVKMVPVLYRGPLAGFLLEESIQSKSNGNSVVGKTAREGIVVKLTNEESVEGYGRLIIKQRSPTYLAGSEN